MTPGSTDTTIPSSTDIIHDMLDLGITGMDMGLDSQATMAGTDMDTVDMVDSTARECT